MTLFLSVMVALILDRVFAEPRRWHPLVGFGKLADWLEKILKPRCEGYIAGVIALALAIAPFTFLAWWFESQWSLDSEPSSVNYPYALSAGVVLYLAIGWQSLLSHARAVSEPLKIGDMDQARYAVSMIVSRDTDGLNEQGIAVAATESVLENGADAIFSALFWFIVGGIPGVVMYRLSNTLDAMWGYRNTRFIKFGWAAARFDDLLNLIPARLTAFTYAVSGKTLCAFHCWRLQANTWKSPNAGPVMASGAGALNVSLGGGAIYHGQWQDRPSLGPEFGSPANADTIKQACGLVNRSLLLWGGLLFCYGLWI
ncbi:adenosylcobinamide-phosphate synthase CbiB [Hahella ganghwensis]|uniref:adenosylcobinamide-phosphate synthase CbiB n=1 Tax=Hahella ganghwensis TaxID=286420 RepID=UPI00037E922B|nr:adenosylcobinamide-phosphate synthase CbiB [Hahella ganghwensis]